MYLRVVNATKPQEEHGINGLCYSPVPLNATKSEVQKSSNL